MFGMIFKDWQSKSLTEKKVVMFASDLFECL